MHQYMITTDVHNLFGFAHVNCIGQSLVDLAAQEGRNPPLVALKNGDVLAFVEWKGSDVNIQLRVGMVISKTDKTKGGKKKGKEEALAQKKFRHMSPKNLTVVLLPAHITKAFFPELECSVAERVSLFVDLAEPPTEPHSEWQLQAIHHVSKTMSAHEILAAISAPLERLPGGLGILSVSAPMEATNEILHIRILDTLTRTLERLISLHSLDQNNEHDDWFLHTAGALANEADGHIIGAVTAMLMQPIQED